MRAPQYGHNRGKRRGVNPFSKPLVRLQVRAVGKRRIAVYRAVRLPVARVSGAITVSAVNKRIGAITVPVRSPILRLALWHKNAAILKRRKQVALANPVISKPYAVVEPDRQLAAITDRDRLKSRNDTRTYLYGMLR